MKYQIKNYITGAVRTFYKLIDVHYYVYELTDDFYTAESVIQWIQNPGDSFIYEHPDFELILCD